VQATDLLLCTTHKMLKSLDAKKHLMHYRGPATITKSIPGRRRQFELTFHRTYKRNVAIIPPERTMKTLDTDTFEVTDLLIQHAKPSLYDPSYKLQEETLIICKTEHTDTEWCLLVAEVHKIYPDEIELIYYTTPPVTNYYDAIQDQRQHHLKMSRFCKTWYLSTGKNIGKATIKAPFSQNPDLMLWTGRIPTAELKDLVLATNITINAQGYLDAKSLDIASKLSIGHMTTL
jgi:hypothetical protein